MTTSVTRSEKKSPSRDRRWGR